jgi:hypothetical protein
MLSGCFKPPGDHMPAISIRVPLKHLDLIQSGLYLIRAGDLAALEV